MSALTVYFIRHAARCETRVEQGPVPSIKQDRATQLVDALQKLSGVVLVCWEHKALVNDILPLLPLEGNSPPVPTKWNDDRFDVGLRFDRAAAHTKFAFRELYPRLLSGDSDKPLGKEEA